MKRFRPQVEDLDARIVPAATASLGFGAAGLTLTINGTNGNDDVNILARGTTPVGNVGNVGNIAGNINGTPLSVVSGFDLTTVHIDSVVFNGGKGNDAMNYVIADTLEAGPADSVTFNGGNGNDYFRVVGQGDIAAGSRFNIAAYGGNGKDFIRTSFNGILSGVLNSDLEGGNGNDYIRTDYFAQTGGVGLVNSFVSTGAGHDGVDLNIFDADGFTPINYLISGDSNDTLYSAVIGTPLGFGVNDTNIGVLGGVHRNIVAGF